MSEKQQTQPHKYLTGESVSVPQITKKAKELGLRLWPTKTEPFLSKMLVRPFPAYLNVLTDDISETKLHILFEMPLTTIIDDKSLSESVKDFLVQMNKNKLDNTLGFILTCPVIYSCDVARIFTEALCKRLDLSDGRRDKIHLALHEALVNGLIHGNLAMSSDLRQSAREFVEYSKILNDRLNNPAYAQKSVSIWATWDEKKVEIKIRDEGAGYAVAPTMKRRVDIKAKSGRGLRLIAGTADSCTIDDFGREITLSFMLHTVEHYQVSESMIEEKKSVFDAAPDLSQCKVLVMEDNLSNQTLVARLLNVVGIGDIEMAVDGVEGLNKVVSYKPDLIILDITMPRMNGYEVLHHLKSAPQTKDIPVLIQTASDTRETRDKTFSSGATDFISKPINPLEFFSRVKVHLENRLLVRNLQIKLEQLDEELQSAQKVQIDMLPSPKLLDDIQKKYDLKMVHHFAPSSKLGGDFWQLFPVSATQLVVYLCDFSGHGVAAALNTVRLHTLIAQMNKNIGDPSGFLQRVNAQLFGLLPRGQFATFFCGVFDVERGTLTYAGAGSPPPFLCSDGKITQLSTQGMPLGIVAHPSYEDHVVPFKKGDNLLMFSDAFTESPSSAGVRLGDNGFEKLIHPFLCEADVAVGLDKIMGAFFTFMPPPPPDDATAVLIRFMP